jgi:hypothetical protein
MSDAPQDAPKYVPPVAGPEHRVFEKDVGTWDAEIVMRFPGAPAHQTSKGVSVNRLVAGGLWLVCDFKNETTGFEGHGVYGYDTLQKKYVASWVDPMRSFLAPMEGTWDAGKRTMTFYVDYPGARGPVRWRETTESVDERTQIFRTFMPGADGETEVMTVTYRRRG